VLCPSCTGFLIEGRLVGSGIITPEIGKKLAEMARQQYRPDGSAMLEITEQLARSVSR